MMWNLSPKGACMRCGFKYRLQDLRKEWTGERVCEDCWDRRPEDLRPIPLNKPEGRPKPNASPDPAPIFIVPGVNDIKPEDL